MFCTKCGKLNHDDAAFCFACGNPMKRKAVQNQIVQTPMQTPPVAPVYAPPAAPVYAPPSPPTPKPVRAPVSAPAVPVAQPSKKKKIIKKNTAERNAVFEKNMRSKWRAIIATPYMLVITILYSLSLLLSLIDIPKICGLLTDLSGGFFRGLEPLLYVIVLLLIAPFIITVLGLWLAYFEGRKKDKTEVGVCGLQLIRIGQSILLAFAALFFFSLLLGSCAAGASYYYGGLMLKILIVAFVACVCLFINMKTVGHSIYILRLGVPHGSGMIALITCRTVAFLVLTYLFIAFAPSYFSVAWLVHLLAQAAIIGYIIIYKTKMEYIESEFDRLF